MKVRYIHGRKGVCSSNILWNAKHPMRGGKFPPSHPCADNAKPMVSGAYRSKAPDATEWTYVPGETTTGDTALDKFRMSGYWASCFPEGDGMTIDVGERTEAEVIAELRELAKTLGFKVTRTFVQKRTGFDKAAYRNPALGFPTHEDAVNLRRYRNVFEKCFHSAHRRCKGRAMSIQK
jgi:hypothetical protein